LPYDLTDEELSEHMSQAGTVHNVHIIKDESGMSRGNALVRFTKNAEAAYAIESLSESTLKGRTLFIRQDESVKEGGDPKRIVFIRNLDSKTTKRTLVKELTKQAGEPIRMVVRQKYAVVEFSSRFEAGRALHPLFNAEPFGKDAYLSNREPEPGAGNIPEGEGEIVLEPEPYTGRGGRGRGGRGRGRGQRGGRFAGRGFGRGGRSSNNYMNDVDYSDDENGGDGGEYFGDSDDEDDDDYHGGQGRGGRGGRGGYVGRGRGGRGGRAQFDSYDDDDDYGGRGRPGDSDEEDIYSGDSDDDGYGQFDRGSDYEDNIGTNDSDDDKYGRGGSFRGGMTGQNSINRGGARRHFSTSPALNRNDFPVGHDMCQLRDAAIRRILGGTDDLLSGDSESNALVSDYSRYDRRHAEDRDEGEYKDALAVSANIQPKREIERIEKERKQEEQKQQEIRNPVLNTHAGPLERNLSDIFC
jgi:hypothetical protein